MNGRIEAIDVLRALAIIGMVLSGQMIWHADLPAAMFHAQLPPPTFAFNPEVAGITWVDLVFPFFLFSMGAAIPLALRKRESRGEGWQEITRGAVHRWLWLALFAIFLGNTRMGLLHETNRYAAAAATLVVWGLFFVMFVRVPSMDRRKNTIMNWCGCAALIIVTALYSPLFGVDVSVRHSDIIILILSNMALFGTLAWWFTRNSLTARIVILAVLTLFKLASGVETEWGNRIWEWEPVGWLFSFDYIQYLCIIIPGTIAGDIIHNRLSAQTAVTTECEKGKMAHAALLELVLAALTIVSMWGMFTRRVALAAVISILLCVCAEALGRMMEDRQSGMRLQLLHAAMIWLLLGYVAEPLEGGIKKDPATVSYFFVTSALASFVVLMAMVANSHFKIRFRVLSACGANPMFAYTASGYLITPVATLTMLSVLIGRMAALSPWCGFLRGVIYALLVVAVTYPMTRKNIYWKS